MLRSHLGMANLLQSQQGWQNCSSKQGEERGQIVATDLLVFQNKIHMHLMKKVFIGLFSAYTEVSVKQQTQLSLSREPDS